MKRFVAFEDSALLARLGRLTRAEVALQYRIQNHGRQAEREGRWVPSDPIYQRLASILKQVRSDLHDTEQEHLRRTSASAADELTQESSLRFEDSPEARLRDDKSRRRAPRNALSRANAT